jgi:hypothetical protein
MFAKLWIATISLVVPVRPSAWNSLAPTGWNFMISDWEFFQNLLRKFKFDWHL